MNYTIQDIIKIIPLETDVRQDLLQNYESYSEPKKNAITSICWDAFNDLTDELTEAKQQQILHEIEEGKRELNGDVYEQAHREVDEEFEDILSGKKQELQEVEHIRAKLQDLMKNTNST